MVQLYKKPLRKKLIKNIALSIFTLLFMAHALAGIWWLAAWWLIVLGIFLASISHHSCLVVIRKKSWLIYSLIFPGVFLLAISLRVLVFGVFYVPSSSMERTIMPGDMVWGNKLIYGPALPRSPYEIPWVNLFTWLIEGSRADLEKKWWEPGRLQGYGKARPGDIAVFEDPENNSVMMKRCMGTPGDTVIIVNGRVYINNRLHEETGSLLLYSRVNVSNPQRAIHTLDSLGISKQLFYSTTYANGPISLYLTREEIDKISLLPEITRVSIEKERPDTAWWVYPHHWSIGWSIDDYGPFVIPKKGMKIALTPVNWILYGNLINKYENADIHEIEGKFFLEGDLINSYAFQKDYYFMLGDNRHDSRDSRYFGPVPNEKIISKATMILYSRDKNIARFSRLFKRL